MADRNTHNPAGDSDLKQKLKDEFSDGRIPTGANFGELIDAFALEAELAGVSGRVDALEHPANGSFTETVAIGEGKDTWTIRALDSGALDLRAEADNTGGWVQMPARIGALQPYAETDRLAEITALGLEPTSLSGRDQILVSPRPGPFAVEVVATVEPAPPAQTPDGAGKSLPARIWGALARPPVRTGIIRATAISAGEETPPRIDQQATPLTTFRVAATRTIAEFLLILGLIFFLADNINSEIQQIPEDKRDSWFEKSFPITVRDQIACPVMSALAAVKLYKMPADKCPASKEDGDATGGDGTGDSGTGDSGKGSGTEPANGDTPASDPASGDGSSTTDPGPAPTPGWEEQLTGEAPVNTTAASSTNDNPTPANAAASAGAASASGSTAAAGAAGKTAPATNAAGGGAAVTASDGQSPAASGNAAAGEASGVSTFQMAYSVAGLVAIVLLAFLRFRSIPMWFAMRRGLIVRWVKNPKAAGGRTLMLQRRGVLSAENAKVRCHMTQLWG